MTVLFHKIAQLYEDWLSLLRNVKPSELIEGWHQTDSVSCCLSAKTPANTCQPHVLHVSKVTQVSKFMAHEMCKYKLKSYEEGEQFEDWRNTGESSRNSGDRMDQRVQSLMFMMMKNSDTLHSNVILFRSTYSLHEAKNWKSCGCSFLNSWNLQFNLY